MELSPLAKEKLAKIGELTEDEKERLKLSNELTGTVGRVTLPIRSMLMHCGRS